MDYTIRTIFHWKGLNEALDQTNSRAAFYEERGTKLQELSDAGKTNFYSFPVRYVTNSDNVDEFYVTRNYVDQASAQELIDFFDSLVKKYGVETTLISREIVDIPAV